MPGKKTKQTIIVLIGLLIGYLITTVYVGMILKNPKYLNFNLIGIGVTMAYLQIIGIILGAFAGIMTAAFAGRKGFDKSKFLEKVKSETFSFMGLTFGLLTFLFNVALPNAIPSSFGQSTPQGMMHSAPSSMLTLSIFFTIMFMLLTIGFFFRFIGDKT